MLEDVGFWENETHVLLHSKTEYADTDLDPLDKDPRSPEAQSISEKQTSISDDQTGSRKITQDARYMLEVSLI